MRPDTRGLPGSEFADLLQVTKVDQNTYEGYCLPGLVGRAFGGNVAAQALRAAGLTVPSDRQAHSAHLYFVAPGRVGLPFRYEVAVVRDGRSLSVRKVTATQENTVCLEMICSLAALESSTEHQAAMPAVPGPENLLRVPDLVAHASRDVTRFLDLRPLQLVSHDTAQPPVQLFWMKVLDPLAADAQLQTCALTYLSDVGLARVGDRPHLAERGRRMGASLDHSIWFHRPFLLDDWILVDQAGPTYSSARALCHARFFARDGRLVASCSQEALIRRTPDSA